MVAKSPHESSYREAEERFWRTLGSEPPGERWVRLARAGARVRLLELGSGPMLLFVHGGPNAASKWAPLATRLTDFRCVLLERPGCGVSEPPARAPRRVRSYVSEVLDDALGALDEEPAAIVASSFGSFCALAFASAQPGLVRRIVHLGCPALVPGARTPLASVLPALPLVGGLVRRLQPPSVSASRRSFERMGHPQPVLSRPDVVEFLRWYTALMLQTDTRRNDSRLFGRCRPRDSLSAEELRELEVPMSFFWGEDDPFGGPDVARQLVDALPHASFETLDDGGHLPWLDAPDRAAAHVRAAAAPGPTSSSRGSQP